jgi:DNA-binding Lrp family transcriptional regulator
MYPTYVFANVQRERLEQVVAELRKHNEIEFFAPVTGRYDLILRLKTNIPEQVYSIVEKIRGIPGIVRTSTYLALDGFTNGQKLETQNPWAFSLLTVNKPLGEVLQKIKKVPGLVDAYVVPGQFDVIMTLNGRNHEEIMRTAVEQLRQIDGIWMSETLFAYKPFVKA